jgi:hypothetical protein
MGFKRSTEEWNKKYIIRENYPQGEKNNKILT